MIRHLTHVMFTKATRTAASTDSTAISVKEFSSGLLFLDVGAVEANSSLDITIYTSPDDGTTWHQLATMTQVLVGQASTQRPIQALTDMGSRIKATAVIASSGTKSVNFGLKLVGKGEY